MKKYTPLQIIIAVVMSPIWLPLGLLTVIVKFNYDVIVGVWNGKYQN